MSRRRDKELILSFLHTKDINFHTCCVTHACVVSNSCWALFNLVFLERRQNVCRSLSLSQLLIRIDVLLFNNQMIDTFFLSLCPLWPFGGISPATSSFLHNCSGMLHNRFTLLFVHLRDTVSRIISFFYVWPCTPCIQFFCLLRLAFPCFPTFSMGRFIGEVKVNAFFFLLPGNGNCPNKINGNSWRQCRLTLLLTRNN